MKGEVRKNVISLSLSGMIRRLLGERGEPNSLFKESVACPHSLKIENGKKEV